MSNGTAPIPASSGRTNRHRLNRGGNRQLNRILHFIALTQISRDPEGAPTTSANSPKDGPKEPRSGA
jgi:transposase